MIVFDQLNPTIEIVATLCDEYVFQIEEEDNKMFDVGASMEEYSQTLIIVEISLFQRLFIPQSMCVDPFA